jgi:ABC-type lipoprotein release transport system permease subunit
MAVAVARRTRELGIRIALGANPRRVLRTVFARAARQLGGGIIAGNSLILLLAWRADSLTADLLVSSMITSVIMAAVGVLACVAPARRALRIQPTESVVQTHVREPGTAGQLRKGRDVTRGDELAHRTLVVIRPCTYPVARNSFVHPSGHSAVSAPPRQDDFTHE